MTLAERYEKERQMETDQRIRELRIRSVEHLMEYKLDPFGPEFDKAGKKLQQLRAEQHQAGMAALKFHQETLRLEEEARAEARRRASVERQLEEIDRAAQEEQERQEALAEARRREKEREHLEALVIQAEQEHAEVQE